jgi:hypothetical protein
MRSLFWLATFFFPSSAYRRHLGTLLQSRREQINYWLTDSFFLSGRFMIGYLFLVHYFVFLPSTLVFFSLLPHILMIEIKIETYYWPPRGNHAWLHPHTQSEKDIGQQRQFSSKQGQSLSSHNFRLKKSCNIGKLVSNHWCVFACYSRTRNKYNIRRLEF